MAKRRLCLIAVASPERLVALHEVVDASGLDALVAQSCREVRRLLEKHSNVDLVITDLQLPGGNWSDVMRYVAEAKLAARVLVSSPLVEEKLLTDVLGRGGFDVLLEPYDVEEVKRVIEIALQAAQTSNLKRKLASPASDQE